MFPLNISNLYWNHWISSTVSGFVASREHSKTPSAFYQVSSFSWIPVWKVLSSFFTELHQDFQNTPEASWNGHVVAGDVKTTRAWELRPWRRTQESHTDTWFTTDFKELLRWKCTTCWIWNELSLSLEYGARFGTRGYRRSRLDKLWLLFSLFAESDRKRCPRNFSRWRRKRALLWLAIFDASRLLKFLYEIISSTWNHERTTIAAKFLPFQKFTMIRIFLKGLRCPQN